MAPIPGPYVVNGSRVDQKRLMRVRFAIITGRQGAMPEPVATSRTLLNIGAIRNTPQVGVRLAQIF